jgi:hypothetical protein
MRRDFDLPADVLAPVPPSPGLRDESLLARLLKASRVVPQDRRPSGEPSAELKQVATVLDIVRGEAG